MEGDYLQGLNKDQREAVLHREGPLLVLAGAGAGKTRVLTHRILNLIKNGALPESILAITFTNKAAGEMRSRVLNLLGQDTNTNLPLSLLAQRKAPFVSTFHSLGVHILRNHSELAGRPRTFTIFDRQKAESAIKQSLKNAQYDPKQWTPRKMLGSISKRKGDGISFSEFEAESEQNYFTAVLIDVWKEYEKILEKEKALDFDDLLLKTSVVLRDNKNIRNLYQERWHYVHIDEYQDTNNVQYLISKHLVGNRENICVVGDIDQTIYTWRGANLKNILNFEQDYPKAKNITLEQNYRSTKSILAAANDVIKHNTLRREKNLFTSNEDGEPLSLYVALDEKDEAEYVAQTSKKLTEGGTEPDDIAVLYRTNFQSRALEEAFLKNGVPYQILGTRFFDRKEIKDLLAYISYAHNSESVSDLKRIINEPKRGIGKVSLMRIVSGKESELSPAARKKLETFRSIIKTIKTAIDEKKPSEVLVTAMKASGIEESLENGSDDDKDRLLNIKELVSLAVKYDSLPKPEGIERLLEEAALASDQDSLSRNKSGVKLMTVHASKGLEFKNVFITGLEHGLFPSIKDSASIEEEEEERRLFYVALTRAEKKVYMCYSLMRTIFGSRTYTVPSEFLNDIDKDYIEEVGENKRNPIKTIYLDDF